jgi:hypothetical protein
MQRTYSLLRSVGLDIAVLDHLRPFGELDALADLHKDRADMRLTLVS